MGDPIKPVDRSAWRYYSGFFRNRRLRLASSVAVSVGQSLLVLPLTVLVRLAFDGAIPAGDFPRLAQIGLGLLLLNLVNSGITLWNRRVILATVKSAIYDLRADLLERCYAFSRSFYSQADLGDLQSRLVQDSERLDVMSNALVALFLPAVFVVLVLAAVLLFLNWFLFLVIVAVMPLLFLVSRFLGAGLKKYVQEFNRSFAAFNRGMLFVLQMMDLTRMQTAEELEKKRQRAHFEELRLRSGSMAWMQAAYGSLQGGIAAVASILILVLGGMAVAQGSMSLGGLLSFYVALALLNSQLQIAISAIAHVITGTESLLNLHRLARIESLTPYRGRRETHFSREIILSAVSFRYRKRPVLHEVSLAIPAGRTTAILGPNGSGKTTVVNLILGFYKPDRGRLTVDGVSYDDINLLHWRRQIAVVQQDPLLFPGSIRENITYGSPRASATAIARAIRMADAREFIRSLPEREETYIGQDGMRLSGGQRQRIVLARAFLRRPKLLILDEPTTHLDAPAVKTVLRNLKKSPTPPAVLLISHDRMVTAQAQRVFRLNDRRRGKRARPKQGT